MWKDNFQFLTLLSTKLRNTLVPLGKFTRQTNAINFNGTSYIYDSDMAK